MADDIVLEKKVFRLILICFFLFGLLFFLGGWYIGILSSNSPTDSGINNGQVAAIENSETNEQETQADPNRKKSKRSKEMEAGPVSPEFKDMSPENAQPEIEAAKQ